MSNFFIEKTYALFQSANNKKLLAELSERKIETIIFPNVNVIEVFDEESESLLKNLSNFDWLVFPDVYAAEYFIEALSKTGTDLFGLDSQRVCACGEAVADRLRFSQLHADVIPTTIKTQDVLQAIKDYVFNEERFENLRFLIIQEKNANAELADQLESIKSYVAKLSVYAFEVEENSELSKLKALLKGGAIDEFIFSSHFDVLNLAQLFQTENLADLLSGIKITANSDSARKSLQEFRLIDK